MRKSLFRALVLTQIISSVYSVTGAKYEPASAGGEEEPIYILPILWHGPNNQITTIKEAISLAHLLTSGDSRRGQVSRRAVVAVPDLQEHKFSDGGAHFMFSDELFDLAALTSAGVDYVPLAQLRGLVKMGSGGPGGAQDLAGREANARRSARQQRQQQQPEHPDEAWHGSGQRQGERPLRRRRLHRSQAGQGQGRRAQREDEKQQEDEDQDQEGEQEQEQSGQPDEQQRGHDGVGTGAGAPGWDGRLDAVLFFRDTDFPPVQALLDDMGVGLQAPRRGKDTWLRSPVSVSRGCSASQVEELRRMLRPYRFVAMLSYDDFALQTHKLAGTLLMDCGQDLCCEAYKTRSPLFHKSERIYQLAQDFVGKAIGKGKPFIAAHIRPMPDPCVVLWQSAEENLDPKQLTDICRTDFMYYRFVPNLQWLMRQHPNAAAVFIMTHPTIRSRVFRMLKAGGIQPVFIGMAQFNASVAAAEAGSSSTVGASSGSSSSSSRAPLRTPVSNSLLAMVEEAVAAMATVFLGTAESSMTGMIVQERLARGLAPESTFFMSPHANCTAAPCALRDYYTRRAERLAKHGTLKAMQP